ncbi:Mechanosensitive ion channel-domain-containing protein [Geopyxis carbonaria]|nr:Mechanosensitive ion channel-domain-containing protein [Geopyxis carbonaria]
MSSSGAPQLHLSTTNEPDGTQHFTNPTRPSEDATYVGHSSQETIKTVEEPPEKHHEGKSASRAREEAFRLEDNLQLLAAERVVSRTTHEEQVDTEDLLYRTQSGKPSRSRARSPVDDFDISTNPVHGNAKGPWRPPVEPATKIAKFLKKIHESSVFVRYFTYIVPLVLILAIPLLLGALVFKDATVGGVYLMWFSVWLEIVWLCLWAGRILAKIIPYPVGIISSAFTNGSKKWRDMAKMLEVPATLFFWWLGIYVSFLPIMKNNHRDGNTATKYWERNANIVLLTIFIGSILNYIEKIIIQLIAISFHQRTYADRIELNKFQIGSLARLYRTVKENEKASGFMYGTDESNSVMGSGAVTPKVVLQQARRGAQTAVNRVGDVFGKVAGDFTGKEINSSTSPQQIVLTLLQTTEGSNVLARRLYRGFCREGSDNVHEVDLHAAFTSEEEAEAAFSMFDRDLNGDISCEEMELACVEVGRERKAITASLKDLDSVVGKLDECLTFIVAVIVILVFLSLISKSTAGVLTSASSSVLALSWLFSATAQEFLASIIFVFVKHPFDVGDRVDVYNTGAGTIDTFFVKEIALMYTEFKKLEGHVVQAPNSLLNTLFILNMRRSGALAEGIPIVCKFGTTIDQIEDLRARMLDFVKSEKREYQGKIITELRDIPDMHAVNINVVFFYKSNWQNELVRLQRRNKFMCALMCNVAELGIESPNMRWPGQKASAPVFLSGITADQLRQSVLDRDAPPGTHHSDYQPHIPEGSAEAAGFSPDGSNPGRSNSRTSLRSKKVDFSLGIRDMVSSDDSGDVFAEEPRRGMVPSSHLRRVIEEEEKELSRSTSIASRSSTHSHSFMHRRRSNAGGSIVSHKNRFFGSRTHPDDEVLPTSEPRRPSRTMTGGSSTVHGARQNSEHEMTRF